MNKISVQEQLMQLRAMTIRTGAIHEAQRLQITNWPKLVPGVSLKPDDTVVQVDIENHVVHIMAKSKGKTFRTTSAVKEWVKNIQFWTAAILWPDTRVVFKVNGKQINE